MNPRFTSGLTSEQLKIFGKTCSHCGQPYGRHSVGTFACPSVPFDGSFQQGRVFAKFDAQAQATLPQWAEDMLAKATAPIVPPVHPKLGKVVQFGTVLTKVGKIIEVVPNASVPKTLGLRNVADLRRDATKLCRDHESYVVEQTNAPAGTPRRSRLFWPRVNTLLF